MPSHFQLIKGVKQYKKCFANDAWKTRKNQLYGHGSRESSLVGPDLNNHVMWFIMGECASTLQITSDMNENLSIFKPVILDCLR